MPEINKAYAISDAKISFVSLVNKAARRHYFFFSCACHAAAV